MSAETPHPRFADLLPQGEKGPAIERTAIRTLSFAGDVRDDTRAIAVETPVQVTYADIPFGVMMLTPQDLEDFAYGFSLTEGVITEAGQIKGVRVEPLDDGLRLAIDITGDRLHAHLARKRALSGRTSCGLCGIEDLDALPRAVAAKGEPPAIALEAIERAVHALDDQQPLGAETRAVHAAAWVSLGGAILHVREDVGRHNALDKLIGAILHAGISPHEGFVLITSRASFEMVEKVATFGCRTLIAISAPTALALERARALDLTLVGIARRDSVTLFHGFDRVRPTRVFA